MKLNWKINNHIISEEFEPEDYIKLIFAEERYLNPYLPNYLLDIKLFEQLRYLKNNDIENKRQIRFEIINLYDKIDSILTNSKFDIITLYELKFRDYIEDEFQRDFAYFIDELKEIMSHHGELRYENIEIPVSNNDRVNTLLKEIQNIFYTDYENDYSYYYNISSVTHKKNKIRYILSKIPRAYGLETENTYETIMKLKTIYSVKTLNYADMAKMAICPSSMLEERNILAEGIRVSAEFAFAQYSIVSEYINSSNGIYPSIQEKTQKVKKLFEKVSVWHSDNFGGEQLNNLKKYLRKNRCLAIMEFNNGVHNNMFSISGTELKKDNSYNNWFIPIAKIIKSELNIILGNYDFCQQNILVRRYMHKDNCGYTNIKPYQYLKDDPDWYSNQVDYSCCERKLLAKLEWDNIFPKDILLFIRFEPCPNCKEALDDYENSNAAEIDCNF